MRTPNKASEREDSEDKEKWRLGGYSSSKSNLTNSDDKKMSDWSKQLLDDSLKKNRNITRMVNLQSPGRQEKRLASPRTPEGKISSKIWKQGGSTPEENESMPEMRSKSMNK